MAILRRVSDNEGHYGCSVQALDPKDLSNCVGHKPMVGYCLKVGTLTAGTFSNRDWWMTTPITEIISETEDEVKFKTQNSEYVFTK